MGGKRQLFLKDKKEELLLRNKGDSIKLIMEFFSTNNKNIGHLENPNYNQDIYENLGWQNETDFDVISSFYSVFCRGLAWTCSEKTCKNYCIKLTGKWQQCPPFIIDKSGVFKVLYSVPQENGPDYHFMKKETLAKKILDSETIYSNVCKELIEKIEEYADLAALTHSVANFMPCPPGFNKAKGLVNEIYDFFPLFIDLIDSHCKAEKSITFYDYKQQSQVEIKVETLQSWKEWLIANRETYCLEDYYIIYSDQKNVKHIKGIPFFKTQSLNNPLPRTESEVMECLDTMIWRIQERANRLSEVPITQQRNEDNSMGDKKLEELLNKVLNSEHLEKVDGMDAQILDETYFDMYGDRPELENELEVWDGYDV